MRKRLHLSVDVTIGDTRTHFGTLKRAIAAAQAAAIDALTAEGLDVTATSIQSEWSYVWHESSSEDAYEDVEVEDIDFALVPQP